MEAFSESEIKSALKLYEKHKQCCKKYQQKNREKMNENAKKYYERLKEDPEKYEKYLERCRKRYIPVEIRRKQQAPHEEPVANMEVKDEISFV